MPGFQATLVAVFLGFSGGCHKLASIFRYHARGVMNRVLFQVDPDLVEYIFQGRVDRERQTGE